MPGLRLRANGGPVVSGIDLTDADPHLCGHIALALHAHLGELRRLGHVMVPEGLPELAASARRRARGEPEPEPEPVWGPRETQPAPYIELRALGEVLAEHPEGITVREAAELVYDPADDRAVERLGQRLNRFVNRGQARRLEGRPARYVGTQGPEQYESS